MNYQQNEVSPKVVFGPSDLTTLSVPKYSFFFLTHFYLVHIHSNVNENIDIHANCIHMFLNESMVSLERIVF